MEKNINTIINFEITKNQKLTPQTIYILVYKNAIANGLNATQKLLLNDVKQVDEMIKYNHNL